MTPPSLVGSALPASKLRFDERHNLAIWPQ